VYLYVAEYTYQEQGKKAVSNLNTVYGDETWEPVLTRTQRLGESATVKEALIRSRAGAEKLVWQWYYVHGSVVSSGYMAKLQNAWGTLNGDPAIAAVVVATDLEGGYEGTAALLTRFVTDTRQTVERAIDQTRQH
jgi:EpsI family protein